jgi:predicted HNH restriction endonuclease
MKCGESRPWCLDFHHINPKDKEENLSRMTSHQRKKEDINKEIEKCVVLCANCHRDFHYLQTKNNLSIEEFLF